ncbi:hypothetical protein [Bradyrhizobium sp. USDA 10063]
MARFSASVKPTVSVSLNVEQPRTCIAIGIIGVLALYSAPLVEPARRIHRHAAADEDPDVTAAHDGGLIGGEVLTDEVQVEDVESGLNGTGLGREESRIEQDAAVASVDAHRVGIFSAIAPSWDLVAHSPTAL